MPASGQVTSGSWAATLLGVLLLVTFVANTTWASMRRFRPRREAAPRPAARLYDLAAPAHDASLWRCRLLIAEALIVRQRLSGRWTLKRIGAT